MTGEKPSAIVSRYRAGELSRAQAAEALQTADWATGYVRASMQPGGDYDGGDPFEPESFGGEVYFPKVMGQLDAEDYAAFVDAFSTWKANYAEGG